MTGFANRRFLLPGLLVALLAAGPTWADETEQAPAVQIPGLGDPGKLTAVQFEAFPLDTLVGRDARRQLVVNGRYSSGQVRDLTSKVSYQTEPAGVVRVETDGLVIPLADGKVKVTATAEGLSGSTELTVERFGEHIPINFSNQITPTPFSRSSVATRAAATAKTPDRTASSCRCWVFTRRKTTSTW